MSWQDNCPTLENLSSWLDGQQESEADTHDLEQHIESCEECGDTVKDFQSIDQAVQQSLAIPDDLSEQIIDACKAADRHPFRLHLGRLKRSSLVLKWAAAALILFSAAAIVLTDFSDKEPGSVKDVATGVRKETAEKEGERNQKTPTRTRKPTSAVELQQAQPRNAFRPTNKEPQLRASQKIPRVVSHAEQRGRYTVEPMQPAGQVTPESRPQNVREKNNSIETIKHVWILKDYGLQEFSKNMEDLLPEDARLIEHTHAGAVEQWTILISNEHLRQLVEKFDKHGLSLVSPHEQYFPSRQASRLTLSDDTVRYKVSVVGN